MPRRVRITQNAISSAIESGMTGEIAKQLKEMVRGAANCTHHSGNYRYKEYVFLIAEYVLVSVSRFDAPLRVKVKCKDCMDDGGYCLSCNTVPAKN